MLIDTSLPVVVYNPHTSKLSNPTSLTMYSFPNYRESYTNKFTIQVGPLGLRVMSSGHTFLSKPRSVIFLIASELHKPGTSWFLAIFEYSERKGCLWLYAMTKFDEDL